MDQNNSATLPYIGSRISLISNAEIRYEGILYAINTFESTVALQNVRSFGTEGRKVPEVPPQNKTFQFIVFKGKDIKDLTVCEPAFNQITEDPAIVNVNVPPSSTTHIQPMNQPPQYQQRPGMSGGMGHNDNQGGGYQDGNRYNMMHGRYNQQMSQMGPPNYPMSHGMMGGGNFPHGRGGGGYYSNKDSYPQIQGNRNYGMSDMDIENSMSARGKYLGGMRGGRGGGGGGGGGGRPSSRRVVGELPPQPNSATKKEVSKAFDFEKSNAKFDKGETAAAIVKTETTSPAAPTDVDASAEANTTTTATTTPTMTVAAPRAGYNKLNSFFDTISCETLDRQAGQDARVDRDKQRQLDCETFGAAAAVPRLSRYPRGYRRGGGGRRGGFGYRQGGGRGFMPPMDYAAPFGPAVGNRM